MVPNRVRHFVQHPAAVFALLAVAVHLFYYRTWDAGFVTDFIGLQWRVEDKPIWGFLNCFGFPAMQQVLLFILHVFYNLFRTQGLPWYLLFSSLHILNAFLLYGLVKNLASRFKVSRPQGVAVAAALLFALSPYHTEVLVWRVCLSYLLSGFFILMTLRSALLWMDEGRTKRLWLAHIMFALALFTFELALAIPIISLLLIWLIGGKPHEVKKRLLALSGPQWALTGLYFLLNKIVLGAWVGHYGESVHLRFPLQEMAANFWRYTAKLGLFGRYLDLPVKQAIFGKLDQPGWIIALSIALAGGLLWWALRGQKRGTSRLSVFMILSYVAAILPVLNLYFNNLMRIDGDRYAYVPSLFFFAFLAIAVFSLHRVLAGIFLVVFLGFSVRFLIKTNERWEQSAQLYYSLLDDYRWQDKEHVFLLNLPDNYQGAPMFRDHSLSNRALADALHYMGRKTPAGTIYEVAQYNLAAPEDGVSVQSDSVGVLAVQFLQSGNWWWRGGIGATAYAKPAYRFEPGDGRYRLYLDAIPPGAVFILQKGARWEEVDMAPLLQKDVPFSAQ
jgi:hypothetical protein